MENLSKKEAYNLKKQEKFREISRKEKQKNLKKIAILIFVAVFAIFVLFSMANYFKSAPGSKIVSRNGIHWHPELSIEIKGKNIEIPEGVGDGPIENPIHTHDNSGTIHLEFNGVVSEDQIKLKNFFDVWGKKFDKDCIFNNCNGPSGALKMFVNGKQNYEFGDYVMHDGDKIKIVFQ